MGENIQLCKVWKTNDNKTIIEQTYRTFYDADQCIDFITSYQWRKVFLTLTDHYSYLLELIHDLPQIVFFYIYSVSPEMVIYKSEQYTKLRAVVAENSPDANKQLLEDIDVFQRDLMPMNVVKPIQRKTKLLIQEALNFNEYSVIWLQDSENDLTIDTSPLSDIIQSVKIFFNIDQCFDFIKSTTDMKLFFISSQSIKNDMIIEKVSCYCQIIAIYILQTQNKPAMSLKYSGPKMHGIFSNLQALSEELSKDYKCQRQSSVMPVSVFLRDKNVRTVRDLNKDNVRFLWFQLLIDILIKIPYNDQARDETLKECRKHYGIPNKNDSQTEDNLINSEATTWDKKAEKDLLDFETNYKPTEALKFYTNDSFLYCLFNQAFRTENIDLLFIFRFFLADMYKQLQKLYLEQFPDKLPRTVFRGQLMTDLEFNSVKNNVDHLISINTFFSTTIDHEVATAFSGCGLDPNSSMLSVLFEIEVDVTHSTVKRPFASITDLSTFSQESEVVFAVGSLFRIEYIQDRRTVNGYWYVKLKLVNDDDDDISELRKDLENQYCNEGNLCSLALALVAMGDFERAERYCHILLEYLPENYIETCRIYSCLGMIARNKGDYRTSLSYHEKALGYLKTPTVYNYQEDIGRQYVDIGASYHHLGNLDLAIKYYTMAIAIQKSPKSLSYTYNQIGMLYRDKGDKNLALEYFQKTLHIEEQVLKSSPYKSVLATMHNNIGEIYSQMRDSENALKHLHQALDIRLKGTVPTHTDLAAIYLNLGAAYHRKNDLKKALEFLEKALDIDTQTLGSDHESLAVIHNNIGGVYHDMGDLKRTLYHLETGLRILLQSQAGENHVDLWLMQYGLGMLQYTLGNNSKALKITQKALQNCLKRHSENDEKVAYIYLLLSNIHRKEGNTITTLEYMEKAVEIARISILPHNRLQFEHLQKRLDALKNNQYVHDIGISEGYVGLRQIPDDADQQDYLLSTSFEQLNHIELDDILTRLHLLNSIAGIYSRKENYPMAMKYLNEAIGVFDENRVSDKYSLEEMENSIINTYFTIGRVYYKQKDWTMSLNSFEKALNFALKQKKVNLMLAEIYHSMGLSYVHKMDIFMAVHYFELAISTATEIFPISHPRVQIYLHHLRYLKP